MPGDGEGCIIPRGIERGIERDKQAEIGILPGRRTSNFVVAGLCVVPGGAGVGDRRKLKGREEVRRQGHAVLDRDVVSCRCIAHRLQPGVARAQHRAVERHAQKSDIEAVLCGMALGCGKGKPQRYTP